MTARGSSTLVVNVLLTMITFSSNNSGYLEYWVAIRVVNGDAHIDTPLKKKYIILPFVLFLEGGIERW